MSVLRLSVLSAIATFIIAIYLYPSLFNLEIELIKSSKWREVLYNLLFSTLSYSHTTAYSIPISSTFGLKISLILISFYTAQGILRLFNGKRSKFTSNTSKSSNSNFSHSSINYSHLLPIPFHFVEIPILLSLILFGITLIPASIISYYIVFLKWFTPLIPVLELVCFMTVVMSAGRAWTPRVTEAHDFIKILVLCACLMSFLGSSFVFYLIYINFRLSTLISSLLSSILTLILVQIVTCCQLDHATITDPALIFPYISYNLVLIVLRESLKALLPRTNEVEPKIYPKDPQQFLKFAKLFAISTSTSNSNSSLVEQFIQTVFSPILFFHFLLQLTLLTLAENGNYDGSDEMESDPDLFFLQKNQFCKYFIKNLWPLFGKSFLVIVYSISWLERCHPDTLSSSTNYLWYLDASGFWRWIIVIGSLAWYGKHLIFDSAENLDFGIKY